MAAMKSKELWPILPVTSGLRSLEDQLASFSSLNLPIISADRDKSYSPPRKRRSSFKSYDSWNDPTELTPSPRPGPRGPSTSSLTSASPTQRTLFDLSKRLEDLYVRLYLDYLKGNDVCRMPHPESWAAYRRSSELWFSEEAPRQQHTAGWDWIPNPIPALDVEMVVAGW